MDTIICKTCKSTNFEESWKNGPLICIKCGVVDDIEYILNLYANKKI